MTFQSKKNFVLVIFLLVFTALFAKTIKVGYFLYEGFQNLENNEYSGYGYEYLREIQKYSGWKYEFIFEVPQLDANGLPTGATLPLSYSRALSMLKEGELDIVGSVRKTEEREREFLFPRFSSGIAYEMLTTKAGTEFAQTFEPAVIGIRTGSFREEEFRETIGDELFPNVQFKYFEYNYELEKALLETGEIDFILSSSLRKIKKEEFVYKYNSRAHFFIFNKQRTDLLEEYNNAQDELYIQNTGFKHDLYSKYYKGVGNTSLWLSKSEQEYIKKNPVIRVAHDSSWFPIDYSDAEGNPKGIIYDIFHIIEKQTGFQFVFTAGSNYESTMKLFVDNQTDIHAIFANDYTWADKNNVNMTTSYVNLPMSVVSLNRIDNITDSSLVVAGVKGFFFTEKYLSEYKNILLVDNVEDCMEAVRTKNADLTFVASYSAERLVQKPRYSKLNCYTLADLNYNVCMGIHENVDPVLYQILNKAVNNLSKTEIDQCIYDNTLYYIEPETFSYVMEKYSFIIIVSIILTLLTSAFIVYLFILNNKRKKNNAKLALANIELEKAFRYAEQANRAKSEFLSRVSHDIRTPMNVIMGMTDIALENIVDSQVVETSLNKISGASDFLLELINDVLEMSQIETGKTIITRDFFNLCDLVKKLSDFFEQRMKEKSISFTIDSSAVEHDFVNGDMTHIEQVLMNLLSNAFKYTFQGTVELIITEQQRDSSYSLFTFTVKDTGVGISEDFCEKIWEPFEKGPKESTSSSVSFGLGLSIVKSLVNLMGGTVSVESQISMGSVFTLMLPLEVVRDSDSVEKNRKRNVEKALVDYQFNNECVLIVEDNQLNMEIAQIMLENMGIKTELALDGIEALDKFKQSPIDYYDAILMDIRMPKMDGREATRIIRSLERDDAKTISIIAMSADAFTEEIKISQSAGMNEYVTKPIKKQNLYAALYKAFSVKRNRENSVSKEDHQ